MSKKTTLNTMHPKSLSENQTPRPINNAEIRAEFLDDVRQLVCSDRNITHGDAEDNFTDIANLWNTYLGPLHVGSGPVLNSKDVAIMMCLFKVSRLMSNVENIDNWLDLAGYAACGGGIVRKESRKV